MTGAGGFSPGTASEMMHRIDRNPEGRRRHVSGCRRLADVLEFKPFKNGLPAQPESAQNALAA